MKVTLSPSFLSNTIVAPASKSSMQRACAAALVKQGITHIHNYGISNDDEAALSIIKAFGASVTVKENYLEVDTSTVDFKNFQNNFSINCGESGLSIRMFTPIAAMCNTSITINGSGSLATRPMNFFDEVLPLVGVKIKSNKGLLPLQVTGSLQPTNITIDGSLSSQFLTGLLMAYAASMVDVATTITVVDLKSKPYIDLTLKVMKDFGLQVPENKNYQSFVFHPSIAEESKINTTYTVEGDWSGGAFLLVAGAIAGNIVVKGLDAFSTQADKAILQALKDSGCFLQVEENAIQIAQPKNGLIGLKPFSFDATDCPDLFPPLVALAAFCNGKTNIKGVSRLAHKESNRGITLQQEFGKMGIKIDLDSDTMTVYGGTGVEGAKVHSHHDHRIAMACAVAALQARGNTEIEEANAIAKSYPNFYEHLQKLGAVIFL
jgi:3-phosphoshikimate 1-carboxyvinyltransferase